MRKRIRAVPLYWDCGPLELPVQILRLIMTRKIMNGISSSMHERADISSTNTDERRFQMSLEKKMLGRPGKVERPQTTDVRIAKNPAMNNRKVLENIHRGNPGRAVVPQRLPNLPKVLQRRVIMTPPAPPAR